MMHLCYRGIRYESQSVTLPTVEGGHSAKFLGLQYPVRRAAVNLAITDKPGLAYRGISDVEEIKGRFLGHFYSRPRVLITTI